ncbi:unnamed protein product [Trypanosoma congolense IL3000]|uniref:WGS project CAEQ00000000 data, annotated contig 1886 n=1 Tax=Trypanosoma congolense (strain IL3000) TaxID=1068625 RepID=F9W9Q8_TRYCI|nr:unnamed protein product [Trypanosoma congolense IL3000]
MSKGMANDVLSKNVLSPIAFFFSLLIIPLPIQRLLLRMCSFVSFLLPSVQLVPERQNSLRLPPLLGFLLLLQLSSRKPNRCVPSDCWKDRNENNNNNNNKWLSATAAPHSGKGPLSLTNKDLLTVCFLNAVALSGAVLFRFKAPFFLVVVVCLFAFLFSSLELLPTLLECW